MKEINFGHWEGQLWSELPKIDPAGFRARLADTWNWCPEGGETYAAVSARVAAWLAEVDRDTLAVAHGVVSRVIRGLVLGVPHDKIHDLDVPQDKVLILRDGRQEWV